MNKEGVKALQKFLEQEDDKARLIKYQPHVKLFSNSVRIFDYLVTEIELAFPTVVAGSYALSKLYDDVGEVADLVVYVKDKKKLEKAGKIVEECLAKLHKAGKISDGIRVFVNPEKQGFAIHISNKTLSVVLKADEVSPGNRIDLPYIKVLCLSKEEIIACKIAEFLHSDVADRCACLELLGHVITSDRINWDTVSKRVIAQVPNIDAMYPLSVEDKNYTMLYYGELYGDGLPSNNQAKADEAISTYTTLCNLLDTALMDHIVQSKISLNLPELNALSKYDLAMLHTVGKYAPESGALLFGPLAHKLLQLGSNDKVNVVLKSDRLISPCPIFVESMQCFYGSVMEFSTQIEGYNLFLPTPERLLLEEMVDANAETQDNVLAGLVTYLKTVDNLDKMIETADKLDINKGLIRFYLQVLIQSAPLECLEDIGLL